MRIFPLQLSWIFLATGLFSVPSVLSGPVAAASCSIVARVLQSAVGSRFKPGDGLCQEQTLSSVTPIRVACIGARKVVLFQKPEDLSQCRQSYPSFRGCLSNLRISCKPMRTDRLPKPFLVQPYGDILAKPPSELRWIAIDNADSYQINIIGDKTWKYFSTQSHLKIPSISSKDTIQIIIEAFSKKHLLSTSTTSFNLLEQKQIKTINSDLALINNLNISVQNKTSLKLSIYSSLNLLNESISLISKEIFLQPNNPSNFRLLGDVYLESGLIDEAYETYRIALDKANKAQNQTEIVRSKWGLEQVLAFRLKNEQKSST